MFSLPVGHGWEEEEDCCSMTPGKGQKRSWSLENVASREKNGEKFSVLKKRKAYSSAMKEGQKV